MSVASFAAVDRGIPRRLSARRSDRHYDPKIISYLGDRGIDVLLNGQVLEDVASWDVDAGTVTRQRRYKDGALILEGGVPTFETLKGEVEVRWSTGSAA